MKSLAFPLGVWILFAIAFGFLSSLLIGVLFQLSNYLSEQQLRSRIRELETEKTNSTGQRRENTTAGESNSNSKYYQQPQQKETVRDVGNYQDSSPNTTYERPQEPTTTYRSGSVYSYGYRDPKNSGVGRSESIYDAEYRVITPPYRGVEPSDEPEWKSRENSNKKENENNEDEDDWGFDDEDDFEEDNERYR